MCVLGLAIAAVTEPEPGNVRVRMIDKSNGWVEDMDGNPLYRVVPNLVALELEVALYGRAAIIRKTETKS